VEEKREIHLRIALPWMPLFRVEACHYTFGIFPFSIVLLRINYVELRSLRQTPPKISE
jgi:hypothetical protein